jgi:acyl-ACP thioesterase
MFFNTDKRVFCIFLHLRSFICILLVNVIMDKNIYTKDYTVMFSDVDNRGVSRASAIAGYMQDIATVHGNTQFLSTGDIDGFWVLSRLKYNLPRPLSLYENLSVSTWCSSIKGAVW